jgi:hypothetical protein
MLYPMPLPALTPASPKNHSSIGVIAYKIPTPGTRYPYFRLKKLLATDPNPPALDPKF